MTSSIVACNWRLSLLLLLLLSLKVSGLNNGLALTPPMGLSTWSIFRDKVNHTLITELADAVVDLGLQEAGYHYLLVDDGWTQLHNCKTCLSHRDAEGRLVVDPHKFPNLTATIEYVHSQGLLFGLWFGHRMCADTNDLNGSIDYATLDAQFFATVGVDAIKHDNCIENVPNTTEGLAQNYAKFERLGQALNRTGRPILYDVVLQVNKPRTIPSYDYNYIWSPEPYGREKVQRIANLWWSLPSNKYNCWKCCVHPNEYIVDDKDCASPTKKAAWRGLLPMLDVQASGEWGWKGHADWAGRGKGWNHLDQLGVCVGKSWYGPGFTKEEQFAQVSLWTILASPLIVSLDVRGMEKGDFCHGLISNPRVIAVHKDSLGIPGRKMKNNYHARAATTAATIESQIWGRPLKGGAVAVVFFNRAETALSITASFADLGLSPSTKSITTTNVWTGRSVSAVSSPLEAIGVPPHGVVFLVVRPEQQQKQHASVQS